jgi:hypothetical protein
MNERIKELAEQATCFKEGLTEGLYDIEIFDKEKFAQLIVQECVEVCEALKEDDGFDANFARTTCANEIRQHFGVEQ